MVPKQQSTGLLKHTNNVNGLLLCFVRPGLVGLAQGYWAVKVNIWFCTATDAIFTISY